MRTVKFATPAIGEEEIAEVVETLRSGWIAAGPRVARFEERYKALVGSRHAVATSSCTGALHISFTALGARGGDVLMPTMTFAATALSAFHSGARPVLCDVDDATLNVDVEDVARRMTKQAKILVALHYAGLPCDIDGLRALANGASATIVEDAAHGIGAASKGRAVGSIGDAAAFSFYANKNMTTVEGGMLTTSRDDVEARARPLRLQGMTRDAWKRDEKASWRYDIVDAGFKYPMSDVQAAIGLRQLDKLERFQARRAEVAARYRAGLAGARGLRLPPEAPSDSQHGNHLFVVRLDPAGLGRDELSLKLREHGIETSVHFVPLHLHPFFQKEWGYKEGDFPVAERAFREILSLPMHAGLSDDDVDYVVDRVRALLAAS